MNGNSNIQRTEQEDSAEQQGTEEIHQETTEVVMLSQSRELIDMAAQYRQLMLFYESASRLLTAKLQILNQEFQCQSDRNPIENIKSRLKSMESIAGKMERKGLPFTFSNLVDHIYDIAGIRVVCPFVSDVYQVADMLMQQKDIEVLEIKDYIKKPKENGYRSLHMIVKVEVYFSNQIRKVPVEIQFRTIAMNCWASLEHQLRYKKEYEFTDAMQQELKRCADQEWDTDLRMQKLADALPGFDRQTFYRDTVEMIQGGNQI